MTTDSPPGDGTPTVKGRRTISPTRPTAPGRNFLRHEEITTPGSADNPPADVGGRDREPPMEPVDLPDRS
jgi:hypothetical protein